MTDRELRAAAELALEALEEIALAGMSPAPEMIDSKEAFHARQAWRFIGIAARQLTALRTALAEQPAEQKPVAWMPIATAPKGRIVLVYYKNSLGNGRTMRARYYLPETLDSDITESGWADEGWHEESEAYEYLMPLDHEPTHWMPLPAAPDTAPQPAKPAEQEPYCYTYTENGEEYFAPPTAYVPDHAKPLYTAPQPVIPHGYKLVPDVPTNEWINNLAKRQTGSLEEVPFAEIHQCIAELLEAAPEAPQPAKRKPLTDDEIIRVGINTKSAEPGRAGYILPVTFATAVIAAYEAKNGITGETK